LAFPTSLLPLRYGIRAGGHRVLVGLSVEETLEFETLDDLAPLDDGGGHIAWCDGVLPTSNREKRWLELYQKHDAAWKDRVVMQYVRMAAKGRA
jgi:hypothetical protein